ncbi:MAG: alpha/beta hydrolase, partial [Actinomycetota bacterium]|nr:alpha/beta hydrolase [Actinomycetota bacterium]
ALLCGHSYGGLVAVGAAALLPGLEKLVLYEPPMGGVLAAQSWTEGYERQLEAGQRATAVRAFLREVGGYSQAEIAQMQETPAWAKRLAVAPTVPRELRAERDLALESLELGSLGARCLMLLGSESPAWAKRSTDAYAGALADVRVHELEGHGHGGTVSAPDWVARELIRA